LALAGVGVVVLGFAAWLMFFKGKKAETNNKGKETASDTGSGSKDKNKGGPGDKGKKEDPGGGQGQTVSASELTNLLLPTTDHLTHIHSKELWDTPLGKAIKDRIPDDYFREKTGFALSSVAEVIRSESYRDHWAFNVVQTSEPLDMKAVVQAMA